jgi:hypothetical protein
MQADEFPSSTTRPVHLVRDVIRKTCLFSFFLGAALLASACGPGSPQNGQSPPSSEANGLPELTEEIIRERINDAYVREVPEENGAGDPIFWNFDRDEPKEITIVEKQMDGPRATIILNRKTGSSPRTRNPRQLAGQIRTEWELRTGWALRKWEIARTENISMKYKNLPKTPEQNSNQ